MIPFPEIATVPKKKAREKFFSFLNNEMHEKPRKISWKWLFCADASCLP
jgi:hypothetical protein